MNSGYTDAICLVKKKIRVPFSHVKYPSFGGFVAGSQNTVSGLLPSVSGGFNNTASGQAASVSGGNNRSAPGTDDWAAGSLSQDN